MTPATVEDDDSAGAGAGAGAASPGLPYLRLARALLQLDSEAGWVELRDALWLAQYLPRQPSLPATTATVPVDRAAGGGPATTDSGTLPRRPPAGGPEPVSTAFKSVVVRDGDDAPDDAPAAVYAAQAGPAGVGAGGLRVIRLPSPHPLPEAAAVARAFRPLGRRRRRGPPTVLDEVGTAESIAETGLPRPVLRAERQRWFDAVVAVDSGLTLLAWRPRVDEFLKLLRRRAGLRDVHVFALQAEGAGLVLRAPDGRPASPARWCHGQGGRLLLVVSDACGAAWHDGRMARWLEPWSQQMPVAVAQLLPVALWSHTGLGFVDLRVQAPRRGAPNASLRVRRPGWAIGEPGLVLPVFALDPEAARRWARMLMGVGDARCEAALLPYDDTSPETVGARTPATATAVTALAVSAPPAQFAASELIESQDMTTRQAELLTTLRRSAQPAALKLASALAAIKPLTLPVVRLVHATLWPRSARPEDLAIVLASGLLVPRVALAANLAFSDGADNQLLLDMALPVREQLVGGLTRSEWLNLNLAVQRYVEEAIGSPFDFMAYMEDRQGSSQVAPAALPFARFARQLADRFRPPGSASGGRGARTLREPIAGPGLTVQATVALPGNAMSLRWSDDGGRLGVLHTGGLDLFDGPRLRLGPRSRCGGFRLQVLCHAADADAVGELMLGVARQLEARMQQRIGLQLVPQTGADLAQWDTRVLHDDVDASSVRNGEEEQTLVIVALTSSVPPPSRQQASWRSRDWSSAPRLALADVWAGLEPRSDRWLNALAEGAYGPALSTGLHDLQQVLEARTRPDENDRIEAFCFDHPEGTSWVALQRQGGIPSSVQYVGSPRASGRTVEVAQQPLDYQPPRDVPRVRQIEFDYDATLLLCEEGRTYGYGTGPTRIRKVDDGWRAYVYTGDATVDLRADGGINWVRSGQIRTASTDDLRDAPSPVPMATDPSGNWLAHRSVGDTTMTLVPMPDGSTGSPGDRAHWIVPEGIASLAISSDGRWLAVGHARARSMALWACLDFESMQWREITRAAVPGEPDVEAGVEVSFSPTESATLAVACGRVAQLLRLDAQELETLLSDQRMRSGGSTEVLPANPAVPRPTPARPAHFPQAVALLAIPLDDTESRRTLRNGWQLLRGWLLDINGGEIPAEQLNVADGGRWEDLRAALAAKFAQADADLVEGADSRRLYVYLACRCARTASGLQLLFDDRDPDGINATPLEAFERWLQEQIGRRRLSEIVLLIDGLIAPELPGAVAIPDEPVEAIVPPAAGSYFRALYLHTQTVIDTLPTLLRRGLSNVERDAATGAVGSRALARYLSAETTANGQSVEVRQLGHEFSFNRAATGMTDRESLSQADRIDTIPLPAEPVHVGSSPAAEPRAAPGAAQVIGAQLAEFTDRVTAEDRQVIANCLLFAQLAANQRSDGQETEDLINWYGHYLDVLNDIGWTTDALDFVTVNDKGPPKDLNERVRQILAQSLGPQAAAGSAILQSLEGLSQVGRDAPWITLFNREAAHVRGAKFQLGHVDVARDGQVRCRLTAIAVEGRRAISQVLFFRADTGSADIRTANGRLSIPLRTLHRIADSVAVRVQPYVADYIAALDIDGPERRGLP